MNETNMRKTQSSNADKHTFPNKVLDFSTFLMLIDKGVRLGDWFLLDLNCRCTAWGPITVLFLNSFLLF